MNAAQALPRHGFSARVVAVAGRPGAVARLWTYLAIIALIATVLLLFFYGNPAAAMPCAYSAQPELANGSPSRFATPRFNTPFAALMRTFFGASSPLSSASDGSCICPPASAEDCKKHNEEEPQEKLLICITPTYVRATQAMHMVRMTTILRVIQAPLLWIVVEMHEKTEETTLLLERLAGRCLRLGKSKECEKIDYIHLAAPRKTESISRGMEQRNAALDYIQENKIKGLIYFMDDDNAYDPMLFEEFRKTKRIGILPVGFMWNTEYIALEPQRQLEPFIERALLGPGEDGKPKVVGWESFEWSIRKPPNVMRKYTVDMSGFVFNSELLWIEPDRATGRPVHPVRFQGKPTYIETEFLERLVAGPEDFEPLANNCEDVYVWHVKFETNNSMYFPHNWRIPQPGPDRLELDPAPIPKLSRYVNAQGLRMRIKGNNLSLPFGYS